MTETTDTSGMLASLRLESVARGHLEIVGTDAATGKPTFRLTDAGRAYVESMFTQMPQLSVSISALTGDEPDEPSMAYQYAIFSDDDDEPQVYGDQRWVASGQCLRDCSWPDGVVIRRRRITFDYGEWETVQP